MDTELAQFKTGIDLRQFAETCGYILDKAKSSLAANHQVLRHQKRWRQTDRHQGQGRVDLPQQTQPCRSGRHHPV